MIPPADITNVRSPVLVDAPTFASSVTSNIAQETSSNITSSAVGQLFQAQVLSQLEDGTFVVNVANNALRMALPAGTTVGNTLEMTLLGTDPRPAFLLEQSNDGTSASLSSAAKLINTVLQTAQQAGAPTTLVGKAPLVPSSEAATNPPELATALQDSVEFSGVFYESHVSQWVSGDRPLSDLMREPQMQAQDEAPSSPAAASAQAAAGKAAATNAGTVLQRPPMSDAELSKQISNVLDNMGTRQSATQTQSVPANGLASSSDTPKEADTVVKSTVITQENAQTINLQLNTLEQHRIAWQGELWPGQRMEWEINEDTHGQGQSGGDDDNQPSWQSVVRFDLPSLGKISASIYLSGGHVRVQVNTITASSTATLKAHGDELATALEAAGSPLDSLTIKHDDQA